MQDIESLPGLPDSGTSLFQNTQVIYLLISVKYGYCIRPGCVALMLFSGLFFLLPASLFKKPNPQKEPECDSTSCNMKDLPWKGKIIFCVRAL